LEDQPTTFESSGIPVMELVPMKRSQAVFVITRRHMPFQRPLSTWTVVATLAAETLRSLKFTTTGVLSIQ